MMALLMMCGFDDSALETNWTLQGANTLFGVGRDGIGQCVYNIANNTILTWNNGTPVGVIGNTYYTGFAFNPSGNPSSNVALMSIISYDSGSNLRTTGILNIDSTGKLSLTNNISNYTLVSNTWSYIELSILVNATTWSIGLRINQQSILSNIIVTPANSSSSAFSGLVFANGSGVTTTKGKIDDVYLTDNTGTANNTFLGDCYVRTMLPIDNGASSQFTNSAGTSVNNYSYVDEQNSSSVDYVGATTAGLEDLYAILDGTHPIPNDYVVHAIQGLVYAGKSDTGTPPNLSYTGKGAVGTVRKDAVNFNLGTGYTSQNSTIQTTDPDGNTLTPATVNNMQIGVVTS